LLPEQQEEKPGCSDLEETMGDKPVRVNVPSIGVQSKASANRVEIVYIDFTNHSRTTQLIVCSTFVFIFYILYGYLQELLFQLPGFKPFGLYLTLVQFGIYSILATVERRARGETGRQIPLKTYVFLAFYTVGTMACSNSSVGYLNYPTQVIFKSCKLIPVLIGGILIQGKRYGWIDVLAACFMSLGLILFTLADNQVSPNFSAKGYVLISLALIADAVIGNVQEKAMTAHSASNSEVVFYSYFIGCGYIFVGVIATGQLFDAFTFFAEHPVETYGYATIFSLTGYLGINIVLTLVKRFGALLAVTITTCRKAVTIVLSFVLFTKPFTSTYVWSGLIVLLGIYLNIYNKNQKQWNEALIRFVQKIIRFWQQKKLKQEQRRMESV